MSDNSIIYRKVCYNCMVYAPNGEDYCIRCGRKMQYQAFNVQQETINKNNYSFVGGFILSILGLILSMISVFLPAASVNVLDYNETMVLINESSDAYIILILSIIALIVLLCRCRTYTVDIIIVAILNLILGFGHLFDIQSKKSELGDYSSFVSIDSGLYILIIGGLLCLTGGIILFINKRKGEN